MCAPLFGVTDSSGVGSITFQVQATAATTPIHASLLGTPDHVADVLPGSSGWPLTTAGLELTADGGNSFSLMKYPIPMMNVDDVVIEGPHVIVAGVVNFMPALKLSDDFGATWTHNPIPSSGVVTAAGVD